MKRITKTILKIVAGIIAVAIISTALAIESATRHAKMASVGSSLNTIGHTLREMEAEGKPEPKSLKDLGLPDECLHDPTLDEPFQAIKLKYANPSEKLLFIQVQQVRPFRMGLWPFAPKKQKALFSDGSVRDILE